MRPFKLLWVVFASFIFLNMQVRIASSADVIPDKSCKKDKVHGYGRPNKIQSMANMNAVIDWLNNTVKAHGEEFAQWHVAQGGKVSCRKAGTELYVCSAEGLPCKPNLQVQQTGNTKLPQN